MPDVPDYIWAGTEVGTEECAQPSEPGQIMHHGLCLNQFLHAVC
jgi:hypothetical protein